MDAKSEYDATHSLPPKDTTSEVISNSIVLNSFKLNINPTNFFRPLFQRLQWKMHKPRRSSLHLQRRFSHLYTIALAKFVFRQPAQRQQRRTIHPRRRSAQLPFNYGLLPTISVSTSNQLLFSGVAVEASCHGHRRRPCTPS